MTDHDDLLDRVATRAGGDLPCATSTQIEEAEAALGFTLPPLLARLYQDVGNGGFGPDCDLMPLIGPRSPTAVTTYQAKHALGDWPTGVLPILDWGCAMYAAIDCAAPDAPVLLYEPNAVTDDPSHAWFQDAPSLATWLTNWLTNEAWYDNDAPNLPLWPQAGPRLPSPPPSDHHRQQHNPNNGQDPKPQNHQQDQSLNKPQRQHDHP
ncbi:SMI1/KNR4 family protein [Actinomadura harenae]|uniref:SMI1/KNR4 family protein n=1 Tax=Actinomadura harenae TaxID=2483351 RepID=A0A3M2LUT1_9ACTN|nr:SMI1/KNR4 family protein [Actinomadura harenae]RMI40660.1 SMI1/KNR4 family protein [Actinomadura harenae]